MSKVLNVPVIGTKVMAYFRPTAITDVLTRHERRALSRSGAYVAEVARRSIHKRRNASQPGKPPHSHTGKLRAMIASGVDSSRVCAVAGALPRFDVYNDGKTPHVLEHGGLTKIKTKRKFHIGDVAPIRTAQRRGTDVYYAKLKTDKQLERAQRITSSGGDHKVVPIAARPFMSSALIQSESMIQRFFAE